MVEQFFCKFPKTVILGQNSHFSARLGKIGQNEIFFKKSASAILYPYGPPTSFRDQFVTSENPSGNPEKGKIIPKKTLHLTKKYKNWSHRQNVLSLRLLAPEKI